MCGIIQVPNQVGRWAPIWGRFSTGMGRKIYGLWVSIQALGLPCLVRCATMGGMALPFPSDPKLGRDYDLTPEDWVAIYDAQSGRCLVCDKRLRDKYRDPGSGLQVAAVDHDHGIAKAKGKRASIRGLLCTFPCNRFLVKFWTEPRLYRAHQYVRDLPAQRVLLARPGPEA